MRKIIAVLAMMAGVLLAVYPFISNRLQERAAEAKIRYVEEETRAMNEKERQEYVKTAKAYNEALTEAEVTLADPFDKTVKKAGNSVQYEKILRFDPSGIMGYVEIPCIDCRLPIYHGTSPGVLQKGVGHLEGSSLPVGGESTHAVLTGHTGLNRARLFTDLTALKKGDTFLLTVLDETLMYCVDEIYICLPEDISKLCIIPGEDHVTLVTCTPYGVNDHRLLVRGTRIAYPDKARGAEVPKRAVDSLWMASYKRALVIGFGAGAVFLAVFFLSGKLREWSE